MFAAVDLGSNSFRLHIGRLENGVIQIVKTAREPVRLGAGLDANGNLTPAAIQTGLDCLRRFGAILSTFELAAVRVVATNTLRIAGNAHSFLTLGEVAIRYPIEIISGEEEGRLIYLGVARTLPESSERRLVVDIGGGSTELVRGAGYVVEQVESFSIGTAKHSATFFADGRITAQAFDAAIMSARSVFEDAAPLYRAQFWEASYGSSGTIRVIAEVIARNRLGDGQLSLAGLRALKNCFIEAGSVANIALTGMKPERAAVVVGGLAILIGVFEEISIAKMSPIEAGLRMGVLWDLQLRDTQHDRREQSVRRFLQLFRADEQRANEVANSARELFIQLKPSGESLSRYLYWSALLHEVGMVVSHSGYHKHAAYVIEHADLPGFTTREQRLMSNLILAQKGNLKKINELLVDIDYAKAVLALRVAIMLMHARIPVDLGHIRLKMKNRDEIEIRHDLSSQHPTIAYWMEKESEWWAAVGTIVTLR